MSWAQFTHKMNRSAKKASAQYCTDPAFRKGRKGRIYAISSKSSIKATSESKVLNSTSSTSRE